MKKFFLLLGVLGVLSLGPIFAQDANLDGQSASNIYQRLQERMPLFTATACSNYLLPYGSSEKAITESAKRLGLLYVAKEPLPQIQGAYMLAFIDPENIRNGDGDLITSTVVHIFAFHPSVKYFSYSIRMQFTDMYYASYGIDNLYQNLETNLSMVNIRSTNSGTVRCDEPSTDSYDRVRMFSVIPDKTEAAFTFTVMDLTAVEKLSQSMYNKNRKR